MNLRAGRPTKANQDADDRNPVINPVVKELLDHLAQELAAEYIRLSEEAASDESCFERELEEHAFGGYQS